MIRATRTVSGPRGAWRRASLAALLLAPPPTPTRTPLIVHNIGKGPEIEDMLFDSTTTGHYRYRGE